MLTGDLLLRIQDEYLHARVRACLAEASPFDFRTSANQMADLFDFKGRHLRQVRELSETEYLAFRRAVANLGGFRRWYRSLRAVTENQREMLAAVAEALPTVKTSRSLVRAQELIGEEANRRFQNYLASFRFFLDHTETRIKRLYADRPEILQSFRAATSRAFDESFPYRFFHKLRNFAQHCGPPIGHVHVSKEAVSPQDLTAIFKAALQLDVPQLLGDYDGWGRVKSDLEAAERVVDVGPLIPPVTIELIKIRTTVVAAERPELQKHASLIGAVLAPVAESGGVPLVGVLTPIDAHRTEVTLSDPPRDVLRWLGVRYVGLAM